MVSSSINYVLPLLLYIIFLTVVRLSNCIVIDNEIEAQPRVYCFQNGLKLQVETKNPFTGHIYVKGMYGNPQCNRNFTGETKQPALNVAYNECIHNREALATGGMMFMLEVIVQFHPYFTTKIDRAFIVSCSYREAVNIVTQNQVLQGNVMLPDGSSDSIPVTRVSYAPLMPNCQYTIHRGAADGPLISFARVGEKVVHKWECLPTADGEFHGILVHNCFARDVHGNNRIQILDQRGCTLDPFSLPTPTYTLDLTTAYASVHAFKFADDLQISFSCSISLCLRMNSGCVGISPPQCDGGHSSSSVTPSGGYGKTPANSYGSGANQQPSSGYAISGQQRPSSGISYAFQDSAPSSHLDYSASFDINSTSLLWNLSDISLPEPPPVNIFYEVDGSKPRRSELLLEPSVTTTAAPVVSSIREEKSTTTAAASMAKSIEDLSIKALFERLPKKSEAYSPPSFDKSEVRPLIVEPTTTTLSPSTSLQPTPVVGFQQESFRSSPSAAPTVGQPHTIRSNIRITTSSAAADSNLGIFVGEGVINVQPVLQPPGTASAHAANPQQLPYAPKLASVQLSPPGYDSAGVYPNNGQADVHVSTFDSAAAFTNSKQKDAEPVIHHLRMQQPSIQQQKTKKSGPIRYRTKPTTTMSPEDYQQELIEASVDVVAQDFVVFDRRNPLPGIFDNDTWRDDSVYYRRARNDICVTTFAFTQIVISAAIFFSSLIALAVFLHMRHRKKCTISDVHY